MPPLQRLESFILQKSQLEPARNTLRRKHMTHYTAQIQRRHTINL